MLLSKLAAVGTLGLVAGAKASGSLAENCGRNVGEAVFQSFSPEYKGCVQQVSQILPNLPPPSADALCFTNHIAADPEKALDKLPSIMDQLPAKCQDFLNREFEKVDRQVRRGRLSPEQVAENTRKDPEMADFAQGALEGFSEAARKKSFTDYFESFKNKKIVLTEVLPQTNRTDRAFNPFHNEL